MAITKAPAIFTCFEDLPDPRLDRGKQHVLLEMIVMALCAAICGAEGWTDVERFAKAKREWFRKFLRLENGVPSHDTFGRVFGMLDTEQFYTCLQQWLENLELSLKGQGVAIDGKTLRRSFDRATGKAALHVVSAWAGGLRICLGQVAVEEKSNEITAVPRLLELLELTGAVVTLDAMHCQKETAAKIRQKGADYVLLVKGNQPTLHEYLLNLFLDCGERDYQVPGLKKHRVTERNRGRDEQRECFVIAAPQELRAQGQWQDLQSVGMIVRTREGQGQGSDEVAFFISSLPPQAKRLAGYVRGHWSIENSLHWSLDVTFSEDQSRLRKDNGPEIAAVFRRLALSLLKRDTSLKSSLRGKRLQAGWNNEILEDILCQKR